MFKFIRQFLARQKLTRATLSRNPVAMIEACRSLLKDTPSDPKLHNDLGFALEAVGDLEGAETSLRRSVELSDHCIPWNNLGRILAAAGRPDEATKAFQRAATLDPSDPQPQYNLLHILRESGPAENLLPELERFLTAFPDHAGGYNDLGCYYDQAKEPLKALASLEKAVELDPGYLTSRLNLIRQLCDLGRYPDATPHLQALAGHGMNVNVKASDSDVMIVIDGKLFYQSKRPSGQEKGVE